MRVVVEARNSLVEAHSNLEEEGVGLEHHRVGEVVVAHPGALLAVVELEEEVGVVEDDARFASVHVLLSGCLIS